VFTLRREHGRFCSARCRAAWNRERTGDPAVDASALQWSITAMSDTTKLLPRIAAWDRPRAFAAIEEAVWSVTIVDARLVRHHLGAYDEVMMGRTPPQRQLIEETLTGLRFVRNRIAQEVDLAEFIELRALGSGAGRGRISGWTWKAVPEPAIASLPPRAKAWEMTRYQAYQAQLADRTVEEVFGRAVAFLKQAAANATSITDNSAHATP
jgi:hypothetical protein